MIKHIQNLTQKYVAESALLFMTVIWGGTFVVIKMALDSLSPMLFISVRFSIAALILLPLAIKNRRAFTKPAVRDAFILGLFFFAGFAFQTLGLKFTSATKSAFITGTVVVMVPIFQTVIHKRPPTIGSVSGALLVFLGIIFLSSGGDSIGKVFSTIGGNFNIGDFFTFCCAIMYVFYILAIDVYSKRHDTKMLVFMQISMAAVLGFVTALVFEGIGIEHLKFEYTPYLFIAFFYVSILASIVTTSIQTKFQKYVTPTKAGIIFSFEPVFAATFAFFVLNEKITNLGLIGAGLIFFGLLVSELYDLLIKKKQVTA